MRFLFVTDTDYASGKLTGAHRRLIELMNGISRKNDVIFITRNPEMFESGHIKTLKLLDKDRKFIPKHLNGMINVYSTLKKLKLNSDYSVSFSPTSTICYRLCGYRNINTLFRENLIEYRRCIGASFLEVLYFRIQEWMAVWASEKVIVQCENDKNDLIERCRRIMPNVEKKVFVQINNVNVSWMKESRNKEYSTDSNSITMLFIGDFSNKRKGHSILLPAAAKLIDEGFRIKLLVAGDGKELIQYKRQYSGYDSIKFLGRVSNIAELINNSDFEVVPSLIDSCPNTVLEGINQGIPVYGANTGGIPDLLMRDEYLFEPDETNLYYFLRNILINKRYKNDMIEQKKLKEQLTFDWANKIEIIINEK